MNPQRITSQCLALAPEIPGYQIAAYMLELLEKMRSDGIRTIRQAPLLEDIDYLVPIPESCLTIFDVYIDGEKVPQSLTEAELAKGTKSGAKRCLILDVIYTDFSIVTRVCKLDALFYNDGITIESLGNKWMIAFVYYVLSRYFSTSDPNQSNYYRDMYEMQVARVSTRRLTATMVNIGDDL